MSKILFTINYQSSQKTSFEKFLEAYLAKIAQPYQQLTVERYWKIPEQFQASFSIDITLPTKEGKAYWILKMANELAPTSGFGWAINGPHEEDGYVFECIFNNKQENQPLRWAHIQLIEA